MVLFANTGVKHASITMADVGARVVHAGFCTLRAQALSFDTGAHGRSLDALIKDIPIGSSSLFGGDLGKAVAKAATTSRNYKALGDCFILSSLSRLKPPRCKKRKASMSPPFHGENRRRYSQGHSSQPRRFRKRRLHLRSKGKGTEHQAGKPRQPQWQQPKQGSKPKPKSHVSKEKKGSNA